MALQWHTACSELIRAVVILVFLWPSPLIASSWQPTLLINTESFQTIDDSDTGNIELRFGDIVNESVYWDRTPGRFRMSDDLYVDTDLTASGTFSIESSATFGSTIRLNGVTYTFPTSDGSATGKVLKTSAAGVLSWSDDNASGISYADANSYFVNDTGDTMTGALNVVITSGRPDTIGLESPNTFSGSNIHASDDVSSSGGKVVSEGTEGVDGVVILDADQGDDLADTWVIESEAADNDLSIVNDTTEVLRLTTAGALQMDNNMTIGSAAAATDYILTFDGETTDGTLKFFEDESAFQFDSAIQIRGPLSASGHISADGNLTLNVDQTAVDTVLTFGSDGTNETLTFINLADRFEFSDDLRVTGGLYASGGLIVEAGQTSTFNGVTYTFPTSDGAASGKVLKTSAAGVLSWSNDRNGATGSTMDVWQTVGYNCGAATTYLGVDGVAFANATEATADTALRLKSDITVTGLRCFQPTDGTCVMNARVRKNAANAAGTPNCATQNVATCGSSTGVVTFTNGDTIAIQLIDAGASCTDAIACWCAITYTW